MYYILVSSRVNSGIIYLHGLNFSEKVHQCKLKVLNLFVKIPEPEVRNPDHKFSNFFFFVILEEWLIFAF